MAETSGDLEKLLTDVRKTILENKQFIEKLSDETVEDDSYEEVDALVAKDEFEEL
jgi:hypothetical protein